MPKKTKREIMKKYSLEVPPERDLNGGIIDDPMFAPDKPTFGRNNIPVDEVKVTGVMKAERGMTLNPEDDLAPVPPTGDLAQVTTLATGLVNLEARIEAGEELLKRLKEKHHRITTEELPALMESLSLREFTLKSGEKIVITPIVSASLPSESAIEKTKEAEKREELRDRFLRGMAYIKKLGAGAIIKTFVKAELGKDSEKLAKTAAAALKKLGIEATVGQGVHPQTLTAFVKERIQAGLEVDFDLLSVYSGSKAEIKTQKRKL